MPARKWPAGMRTDFLAEWAEVIVWVVEEWSAVMVGSVGLVAGGEGGGVGGDDFRGVMRLIWAGRRVTAKALMKSVALW